MGHLRPGSPNTSTGTGEKVKSFLLQMFWVMRNQQVAQGVVVSLLLLVTVSAEVQCSCMYVTAALGQL